MTAKTRWCVFKNKRRKHSHKNIDHFFSNSLYFSLCHTHNPMDTPTLLLAGDASWRDEWVVELARLFDGRVREDRSGLVVDAWRVCVCPLYSRLGWPVAT